MDYNLSTSELSWLFSNAYKGDLLGNYSHHVEAIEELAILLLTSIEDKPERKSSFWKTVIQYVITHAEFERMEHGIELTMKRLVEMLSIIVLMIDYYKITNFRNAETQNMVKRFLIDNLRDDERIKFIKKQEVKSYE